MFSLFNSPDTWTSTAPLSTDRQSNEQPNQPEYQMCVSNGYCVNLNIGFCIVPIKKEKNIVRRLHLHSTVAPVSAFYARTYSNKIYKRWQ